MTAIGEPERLKSLNREIKNLRDKTEYTKDHKRNARKKATKEH